MQSVYLAGVNGFNHTVGKGRRAVIRSSIMKSKRLSRSSKTIQTAP